MRIIIACVTFSALAAVGAMGQMQDNREKQLACNDNNHGDQARACDLREQTIPSAGRLTIDSGRNGGVSVKGWLRNDVLVRSRVEAWADTDAEARSLASQVNVTASAGQVTASGPGSSGKQGGWSVSYEIFVPQNSDLNLKAHNGGIRIADVRGRLEFTTTNGGVHLTRIAGDVSGSTVNGGVHVELVGNTWDGRQLDVNTKNGGVTLNVPSSYSARIRTETVNGGVSSDFPITLTGNIKPKNLDFAVGSGGPVIHCSTTNGGVKVKKV